MEENTNLIDGQPVADFIRNSARSLRRVATAPRRAIQVATDSTCIIALCDDGSMWSLLEDAEFNLAAGYRAPEWHRLPPIPQDE